MSTVRQKKQTKKINYKTTYECTTPTNPSKTPPREEEYTPERER
jgi:hypothetical protein